MAGDERGSAGSSDMAAQSMPPGELVAAAIDVPDESESPPRGETSRESVEMLVSDERGSAGSSMTIQSPSMPSTRSKTWPGSNPKTWPGAKIQPFHRRHTTGSDFPPLPLPFQRSIDGSPHQYMYKRSHSSRSYLETLNEDAPSPPPPERMPLGRPPGSTLGERRVVCGMPWVDRHGKSGLYTGEVNGDGVPDGIGSSEFPSSDNFRPFLFLFPRAMI